MTEEAPEAISLDCDEYKNVRVVRGVGGFTIEQRGADGMGVQQWTFLAFLSGTDYEHSNKDNRYNDIPGWVFYVVSRLFELERRTT